LDQRHSRLICTVPNFVKIVPRRFQNFGNPKPSITGENVQPEPHGMRSVTGEQVQLSDETFDWLFGTIPDPWGTDDPDGEAEEE